MASPAAAIAIALLVVWTGSSFVPFVPSGVLAALTVVGYAYTTGFTEPSVVALLALVSVSLLASAVELLSGAISGRLGGASTRTVAVGTLVGVALLFVMGPIGLVAGLSGTVFLASLAEDADDLRLAVRRSAIAVIGVLSGSVAQAVLLGSVAAAFAFSVW